MKLYGYISYLKFSPCALVVLSIMYINLTLCDGKKGFFVKCHGKKGGGGGAFKNCYILLIIQFLSKFHEASLLHCLLKVSACALVIFNL